MKLIKDVYEFNNDIIKSKQPEKPQVLNKEDLLFALISFHEEIQEFIECTNKNDVCGALDGLIDLTYFIFGRIRSMGITPEQFEKCWNMVQRANMNKRRGEKDRGTSVDAVKDIGWVAPDFTKILGE